MQNEIRLKHARGRTTYLRTCDRAAVMAGNAIWSRTKTDFAGGIKAYKQQTIITTGSVVFVARAARTRSIDNNFRRTQSAERVLVQWRRPPFVHEADIWKNLNQP